jgi:hypothetical protein
MRRNDDDTKKCVICHITKSKADFYTTNRRSDGTACKRSECGECSRRIKKELYTPRKKKVKISVDVFNKTDDDIKRAIAIKLIEHKVPMAVISRDFNLMYETLKKQRNLYKDYYENVIVRKTP